MHGGRTDFEAGSYGGRNVHFGNREHAMGPIVDGSALSSLRPFGSPFLIFSDFMRGAIRLSSIMDLPAIFIFTHDSIGLGEDGPTHQPIEHLMSLRAMPRLIDMRPADANEVAEAWRVILTLAEQPVALILTRQTIPTFDRTKYASAEGVRRGAYIIAGKDAQPDVILMGSGSEVQFCVAAYETLTAEGVKCRVLSI